MTRLKYVFGAIALAAVLFLTMSFGPKSYEYRVLNGEPDRCEREINDLTRKGWEPVGFAAGGAATLSGEGNSSTNHGARVYALMRRRR